MAGPSAATNFLSPEDYARLLQQAEAENRAGLEMNQAPRHWTQALAGALNQGLSGYREGQARERYGATKAAGAQAMAALLRGDEGAFDAAMKIPGFEQQAIKYEMGRPEREYQQWKMATDRENAPLNRRALESQIALREAQARSAAQPDPPKWTKVGRDSAGQDIYGWVDPKTRQVIPQTLPGVSPVPTPGAGAGQDSPADGFALGEPPPGVDPNEFRKYGSREAAKFRVQARQAFPGVKSAVERTTGVIDGILNSPSWDRSTSVLRGPLLSITEDARAFDDLVAQARGGAFVQAFQDIKGGGAITETEGQAATQALARLQRASVGSENFKKALEDFRRELVKLEKIAAWKAGYKIEDEQPAAPQGATPRRRRWTPEKGLE